RPDARLLPRAHRLRWPDLLPGPADAVGQELLPDRRRPDARRPDARRDLREVLHRPVQAGELGVRRLVVRARAAAGDRRRLPAARRGADALVERGPQGVLPAQAGGRRRAGRGDGVMARGIVLGYDGTEGAKTALVEATLLAKDLGDELLVVFAYHSSPLGGEVKDLHDALVERGQAVTGEALAHAQEAGARARAELVHG